MKNLIQKLLKKDLYPELTKVGGLCIGLNNTFKVIDSEIRVEDDLMEELPFAYARVEKDNKFSQIYIAQKEKFYLPDFWKDGVCLANGKTDSITDLAKSLDFWLRNDISTKELSTKYKFINPNEQSESFDLGNEVEYSWNKILENGFDEFDELNQFIEIAINDHTINKLFPYTSLYTLCFSRCTGYPYDSIDLPNVTPKSNSWTLSESTKKDIKKESSIDEIIYVVSKNKNEYIGEGNAEKALILVKDNLPEGILSAKKGIYGY